MKEASAHKSYSFSIRAWAPDVRSIEIKTSGKEMTSHLFLLGPPENTLLVDTHSAGTASDVIEMLEKAISPGGLKAIYVTHGHPDHFGGAGAIANWSGAPVWGSLSTALEMEDQIGRFSADGYLADNLTPNVRPTYDADMAIPIHVSRILREGDIISHADFRLQVLLGPGHERGGLILWEAERRMAFIGDIIQGGMDATGNWLGLFTDVDAQRNTLKRLRELYPLWLYKGHRVPRTGNDVEMDISAAERRLDAIERALLETVSKGKPLTPAEISMEVFRLVMNIKLTEVPNYILITVTTFLISLSRRGAVHRTIDGRWEKHV